MHKKPLTILVDMDDTLINLCEEWVNILNNKYSTNTALFDIKEWDITKAFPTLSVEEIFSPLNSEELWDSVRPIDGAVKYLKKLIDDGHNVFIVTATHPANSDIKFRRALFRHFPFIPYDHVIIAYKKQMIKADVLIDDAPHNLVGGEYYKILMAAPHNINYSNSEEDIKRVDSWEQAYDVINKIT